MVRRPDLGYRDEGLDLADAQSFASACRPFGAATVLPHVAYRSLQFLYLEDEALWTRSWIPVGTHHEIPSAGDLLPFSLGYHGVHVQRMEDGAFAARFNLAQHGGCRVVPTQCQNGTRTPCHFTSCGYSRDRGPVSAASGEASNGAMHQFVGLRPERLYPVRVGRVGSVLCLNVDPQGTRMQPYPALPLPEAVIDPDAIRAHREWIEFASNWKFGAQCLARCDTIDDSGADWLAGHRLSAAGSRIDVLWLFPNLILLSAGPETCVIVLQHTAIGKVLFRVELLSTAPVTPERIGFWCAVIAHAGQEAAALQAAVPARPVLDPQGAPPRIQTSAAAHWGQQQLISRLAQMPRVETDVPIFAKMEHYLT